MEIHGVAFLICELEKDPGQVDSIKLKHSLSHHHDFGFAHTFPKASNVFFRQNKDVLTFFAKKELLFDRVWRRFPCFVSLFQANRPLEHAQASLSKTTGSRNLVGQNSSYIFFSARGFGDALSRAFSTKWENCSKLGGGNEGNRTTRGGWVNWQSWDFLTHQLQLAYKLGLTPAVYACFSACIAPIFMIFWSISAFLRLPELFSGSVFGSKGS